MNRLPGTIPMGSNAIAHAADENFVVHASWLHRRTEGMRCIEASDVVLTDSGMHSDTFNIACRARFDSGRAHARIRESIEFFETVGIPFSWWVGPADRPERIGTLLTDCGLREAESELAMAVELAYLPDEEAVDGLTVTQVREQDSLRTFARVLGDPVGVAFYEQTGPALLAADSPIRLYLGLLDGVPAATSELTLGGGIAGIYNVSTRPEFRRRGIGTAMTLAALNAARAEGMAYAALQASPEGQGLYARLGFYPFGVITEYKPTAG